VTSCDVGGASGGSRRTEGHVELYPSGLGPGAERILRDVFPSSITICNCKFDRGSRRCYNC
jgi:hypothetical protein